MSARTTTVDDADFEDSIFGHSAQAVSDAAADARAQARIAAQNVKDGVGWGVYKAAFGVSFGVVFTGVFLTELLPGQSSLRRGLEDGAIDALDAIEARKLALPETHDEPFEAPPAETIVATPPAAAPVAPPRRAAPRKRTVRPVT